MDGRYVGGRRTPGYSGHNARGSSQDRGADCHTDDGRGKQNSAGCILWAPGATRGSDHSVVQGEGPWVLCRLHSSVLDTRHVDNS